MADPLEQVAAHDAVESRLGELMGTINAATAEAVAVIADALERGTWELAGGIRSPEHWVTWQCGVSKATADSWVRMARRRSELPQSTALFATGRITEDVMAAVANRAPAERDREIAEQLPRMLYSQVDRLLRTMPEPERPDDAAEERPDEVTFGVNTKGRWVLRANLGMDDGAVVERALTAARSDVFFERHPDAEHEVRGGGVTWADGLVRTAELALRQAAVRNGREHRPSDRLQVWMHLDLDDLRANWHLGAMIPDTLARYLTCDADVRALIESDDTLLGISDKLRTVDDRMRAFVEQRDGGCRVPGCEQRRWLHIHHLVHWEDGGRTVSCNLCALCPMHHRLHHRGLLEIRGNPDQPDGLRFYDHKGREIGAVDRPARAGPAPPSPHRYVHPTGEPIDWHWWEWDDLDRDRIAARN